MAKYKVTHRLGAYIQGLGSRPPGGVFDVTTETAAALRLDDNPCLERVDGRAKRASKPKPKDQEEG